MTFKASPGTLRTTMTAVDATKAAGVYAYALDTSTITNATLGDQFFVDIQQTTLTNAINANQAGGGVYGYVVDKVEANLTVATSTLATSSALATVQADTDDIQTRLPAALVSGRMDASVGAMASGVLTATAIASDAITSAKIATDAIGSAQLAATAVTEIQSGLATATNVSDAQTAILAKLPGALIGGRIDATVGAMQADTLTSAALAASAVTEIQSGLATSAPLPAPEVIESGSTETVPIWYDYVLNGVPVTGTPPSFFVDRVVAGVMQRLDWDVGTFGDPATITQPSIALDELDATYAPGAYYRLWDPAFPDNAVYPCVYFMTIKVGSTVLARREIRVRTVDTINTIAAFGAPPNAASIATQVNTTLSGVHGAGSWATASTAGLALTTDVAAAVAAIEAYGQLHWTTADVSGVGAAVWATATDDTLYTYGEALSRLHRRQRHPYKLLANGTLQYLDVTGSVVEASRTILDVSGSAITAPGAGEPARASVEVDA